MFREAALLLLAEIDQATKKKWKQHLKQPTLFKDTATKLLTELVKGKEAQIPEDLLNQAVEAGSKLLLGSFDAAYEAAVDSIGKALEETSGEQAKAVLDRVLLMDVIDRVAYILALKGILMNVDEEAWNEKGSQLASKLGGLASKLGKELFAKGLGKKALKKVKNIKPEDWGKAVSTDAEKAAASAAKIYLPKVLENFKTYAKQMEEGAGQEGKQEEQKAASVRFVDLAQPLYDKYLATIGTDAKRTLFAVPTKHWAQFANTVLASGSAPDELVIAAENIEKLLGPERHSFFTSPVDIVDGFGVGLAAAEKIFTAIVDKCRKQDLDPKRPASEQKFCLYTRDKKHLKGRHKTEEDAYKQERAIHVNRGGSKKWAAGDPFAVISTLMQAVELNGVDSLPPEDQAKLKHALEDGVDRIVSLLPEGFPFNDGEQYGIWGEVAAGNGPALLRKAKLDPEEVMDLVNGSSNSGLGEEMLEFVFSEEDDWSAYPEDEHILTVFFGGPKTRDYTELGDIVSAAVDALDRLVQFDIVEWVKDLQFGWGLNVVGVHRLDVKKAVAALEKMLATKGYEVVKVVESDDTREASTKRTAFWTNVLIVYPLTKGNRKKSDDLDLALDNLAASGYSSFEDGSSGDSGSERDLLFSFSETPDAEAFASDVEELAAKMGIEGLTVNVSEEDDEEVGDEDSYDESKDVSRNLQLYGVFTEEDLTGPQLHDLKTDLEDVLDMAGVEYSYVNYDYLKGAGYALKVVGEDGVMDVEKVKAAMAKVLAAAGHTLGEVKVNKTQAKEATMATKKSTKTHKRAAAAKQKVAALLKEGKALPIVAKKDGTKWVPDLTDIETRKAFVKYVKAHGISPKDLNFVLRNQKVAVGPFGRGKGKPRDSGDAAIAMLRDEFGVDLSRKLQTVPDPSVEGVWLVFDHGNRYAHIVYLYDHDFETVDDYDEAVRKYGRGW